MSALRAGSTTLRNAARTESSVTVAMIEFPPANSQLSFRGYHLGGFQR
jgi:hypothetical protein